MNALIFLVASTGVGIDVGWQPLSDGGEEYIIQLAPQQLDTLARGQDLVSVVPAEVAVRGFRISVGRESLPRILNAARKPDRSTTFGTNAGDGGARDAGRDDLPAAESTGQSRTEFPVAQPDEPTGDNSVAEQDSAGPTLPGEEPAADPIPRPLDADPDSARLAAYDQTDENDRTRKPAVESDFSNQSKHKSAVESPAEPKPWMTLVFTSLALCVSLGGNVYLGWVAWGHRERYLGLLGKFRAASLES